MHVYFQVDNFELIPNISWPSMEDYKIVESDFHFKGINYYIDNETQKKCIKLSNKPSMCEPSHSVRHDEF